MTDRIATISHSGTLHAADTYELLTNNRDDVRDVLMDIIRTEMLNPHSEFMRLIKSAMELIADEEIEKVLKD